MSSGALLSPPAATSSKASSRKIVRVHLAGTMQATTFAGVSVLPRGRKARVILACLCLAAGRPVSRTRLAALLWDRVPEVQARASLRQSLSELAAAWSSVSDLLEIGREQVRLQVGACWIDTLALPDLQSALLEDPARELLHSLSETLLEGLDGVSAACDEWLRTERSRVENRLREVYEAQLTRQLDLQAPAAQRAQLARDFIQFDPTHERAWQCLLKALLDVGDRGQAMREYQRCKAQLKQLLGVDPSEATRSLYDEARAQPGTFVPQPLSRPEPGTSAPAGARLRVGILPFRGTDRLGDPSLCWSLALDTAAALARFRWFDVITPVALSELQADAAGWDATLERLKVDYVVHGALDPSDGKIRVKVSLLCLHRGAQTIWSDSYDLPLEALGEADEHVIAKLVARIDPVILHIEGSRPGRRDWSDATGLALKAIPLMYSLERDRYDEAGAILMRATAGSPNHSMAAAWLAFWYLFKVGQGWSSAPSADYAEAERISRRAIEVDPENAEALGIFGHLCAFVHHDFDAASDYFRQSLVLNPSLAFIWALSAPTSCYLGDPRDALKRLDRYRDLAPFDPYRTLFESMYAMAHLFGRDYTNAALVGRRSVRANPAFTNGYKPLLAALGHLGMRAEAEPYLRTLLTREPGFCIDSFVAKYPFRWREDREHYVEGLRKAGVPEH